MKSILFGAAVFMLAGFAGSEARAQGMPPATKGKCYPNFIEECIKACIKGGGVTTGCPTWCANQKVVRGCK
jgi:hypothetical protein